ncbi:MAG: TetR/AcrR family transcriptional regulator [Acidimicrobiia bacterium]|nr:TetR/AcrR family transcriptional regulator [Acidimicrobiia bacterium]MDH5521034.1 TetR/AcrR family transcriptional regulator [Acidimicrobiia bacterium]
MTTIRNTRDDVVRAAGRLFADRGYHGTSMRDLGKELGLHGSSLYSHITSKEALLVDVVMRGAELFEEVANRALETDAAAVERLRRLVVGHVDVVLDHLDEARTFLNEARSLEPEHRATVVTARDRYEQAVRTIIGGGVESGEFAASVDPRMSSIYLLSILNALDRWYRPEGDLDRLALVDSLMEFTLSALGAAPQ